MRLAHTRPSAFEALGEELRGMVARRIGGFVGSSLLMTAVLLGIALSTWSVTDPSINHATDAPVRNMLGAPGAMVADLLMQTLGLASMAMLVPLAVWGLCLIARRGITRERARLAAWGLGTVCIAAALAGVPAPASWPLPTGLGGVGGDLGAGFARALLGQAVAEFAPLLAGIVYALGGTWALLFASGLSAASPGEAARESRREAGRDVARTLQPEPVVAPEAQPESDEPRAVRAWMGSAANGFRGALAALGRWSAGREDEPAEDEVLERREPLFDAGQAFVAEPVLERRDPPRAKRLPAPEIEADEDDDTAFLFAEEPEPAPRAAPKAPREPEPAARPRVRPAPPAPTPGAINTKRYEHPSLTLLKEPKPRAPGSSESPEVLRDNARLLEQTLDDFGVRGEILNAKPGPVVTLYELQPAPGIKSSRVIGLADDIARSMSAIATRVATVPGRNVIGIELPNAKRETVWLREMFASKDFTETKARLPLALGKSIGGETVIADLARMPHLLIAGTTGSGKSVGINTMILSLLYRLSPEQCRLIMVDPKMLELSIYDGIPHLLTPVVTDPKKAVVALKWAVREMEERYKKMSKVGVRNIDGFNERVAAAKASGEGLGRTVQTGFDDTGEAVFEREEMALEPLPYIVVIVDEMADLMMVAGKEIEGAIQRLAQMARAAGIHIITATQRPSVDVITGTIKANFPTRISFMVTSKIDSRTILGEMGAEQLLGQGDMLCMMGGGKISRVHGPFVSDEEVGAIVEHLKAQGTPTYLDAITADDGEEMGGGTDSGGGGGGGSMGGDAGGDNEAGLYEQAVAVVVRDKKASTSYVQRRLQIGYNRAASLIERMEKEGVVGPPNHAGKREILVEGDD